jgi:Ca-activated chloride channel homolog
MLRTLASLLALLLVPQTVLRLDVQLQEVVVSVRDSDNRLIRNLGKEAFIIEENGVPQNIVHLIQGSETPVSLGILIDTSGSMASVTQGSITAQRASVGTTRILMRLMNASDEYLLMSFNSGFTVHGTFTTDSHEIEEELRKLRSNGGTNLFPAVTRALGEMKKAKHRKKALIVITDAGASGDFDALRRDIRNSEVLIYTFAIGAVPEVAIGPVPQRGGFGPPTGLFYGQRSILDALASESGGQWESFDMNSEDLLSRMINFVQDIAAELRGQYTLGYYPSSIKTSENHIIRVKPASGQHRVRVHRELK